MHRFYMFHSFTKFHRNSIASCSLFLAAKVEEQPRKLEHVIRVSYMCWNAGKPNIAPLDTKSEVRLMIGCIIDIPYILLQIYIYISSQLQYFLELVQELIMNENIMLQTLGFDLAVDHPHTHVVHGCTLINGELRLIITV